MLVALAAFLSASLKNSITTSDRSVSPRRTAATARKPLIPRVDADLAAHTGSSRSRAPVHATRARLLASEVEMLSHVATVWIDFTFSRGISRNRLAWIRPRIGLGF
jgi:hypothetical protein